MARFLPIIIFLSLLAACASKAPAPPWDQSPDFNDCWSLFPPGANFRAQIEKHMGTTDRNMTELACIPTYHLNEAACHSFKEVGPGDWPDSVVNWCEKYFSVTLEKK
jgi:hypothetical protein